MHPDQLLSIAAQHRTNLMGQAADHRLVRGERQPAAGRALRRRTGWWLVALGLRLAVGRDRRGTLAPAL